MDKIKHWLLMTFCAIELGWESHLCECEVGLFLWELMKSKFSKNICRTKKSVLWQKWIKYWELNCVRKSSCVTSIVTNSSTIQDGLFHWYASKFDRLSYKGRFKAQNYLSYIGIIRYLSLVNFVLCVSMPANFVHRGIVKNFGVIETPNGLTLATPF